MKLLFILGEIHLRKNLTITLTLITKSNFTLSYPNKNYFLKLTFDILKANTINSFESNSFKKGSFTLILLKVILSKVKLNTSSIGKI